MDIHAKDSEGKCAFDLAEDCEQKKVLYTLICHLVDHPRKRDECSPKKAVQEMNEGRKNFNTAADSDKLSIHDLEASTTHGIEKGEALTCTNLS